jgi:hypothetical protein
MKINIKFWFYKFSQKLVIIQRSLRMHKNKIQLGFTNFD